MQISGADDRKTSSLRPHPGGKCCSRRWKYSDPLRSPLLFGVPRGTPDVDFPFKLLSKIDYWPGNAEKQISALRYRNIPGKCAYRYPPLILVPGLSFSPSRPACANKRAYTAGRITKPVCDIVTSPFIISADKWRSGSRKPFIKKSHKKKMRIVQDLFTKRTYTISYLWDSYDSRWSKCREYISPFFILYFFLSDFSLKHFTK